MRSTDAHDHAKADDPAWGDVELAIWDPETNAVQRVVLHRHLQQDDHDGRALTVYTQHSQERKVYWRVSEADDLTQWGPSQTLVTPGEDHPPFGGDNVTYSNLFQLSEEGGTLYNYSRSVKRPQNWMYSDDDGDSRHYGGMFLMGHQGYAPYFNYATNHRDLIHFVGTEDHPRNFDNSVFHGLVRNRTIHQSDGNRLAPLSTTSDKSGDIWELTCVYRGDADHVAWVIDLHLDQDERPVCLFSTQRDGAGVPVGQGGMDHRYHYARWDGRAWIEHEFAYADRRLYPTEDDYAGGAAIDPMQVNQVYLSTDAHPQAGEPLISTADGQRHYELFRGVTPDGGATWVWEALTIDCSADNLRPLVPASQGLDRVPLIWMRAKYEHNRGPWSTSRPTMC